MKTIAEMLKDADPLGHEPDPLDVGRARLRQAVLSGGSNPANLRTRQRHGAVALVAALAAILVLAITVGSWIFAPESSSLHAAAIAFEVRLAEEGPADGLQEARVGRTDRVVFLHPEVIVGNDDVETSAIVTGGGASRYGVHVTFTAAGGEKMQRATEGHVGRPAAILLDGAVVAAPVLRSTIATSALISGDFSRAEAERIAHGIGVR